MWLLAAADPKTSMMFIELGTAVVGLALLARIASKYGFSAIPLYLVAGLFFGNGGIVPLRFSDQFVKSAADVGVVLLLFMLGLEYDGNKLLQTVRGTFVAGLLDFGLNFVPGLVAGLFLHMTPIAAVLLGGVTYVSSSGIIAKVMGHFAHTDAAQFVSSILVIEDLIMAVYLPLVGVLLSGRTLTDAMVTVCIALTTVAVFLWLALKFGYKLTGFMGKQPDEVVLLSMLGLILLASGCTGIMHVSASVGAFLVGVAVSGSLAERAEHLLAPIRDLFAATFFLFFGLEINPLGLGPAIPIALILVGVTGLGKMATGWFSAKHVGIDPQEGLKAGVTLMPRGEFSIVIAGMGIAIDPRLGPIGAAYVLIMAVCGPFAARYWGVTTRTNNPVEIAAA